MFFFFSSRRRHTRLQGDWSSDVCSSDLEEPSLGRPRSLAVPRVCGSKVAVGQSLLKDRLGDLTVQAKPFGLFVFLIPAQVEPPQAFKNRIDRRFAIPLNVSVVQAQDHRPAIPAGIQPVKDKSARAAHMQKTRG